MIKRRFSLMLVLCLAASVCLCAQAGEAASLQQQLLDMLERDQRHRSEVTELELRLGHESPEVQALWERQVGLDRENVEALQAMVARSGWPARSEVGAEAAMAAFLVLQHADPETQKQLLPLLKARVDEGEAAPAHWAMLLDRVRMRDGLPQVYGSQVVWSEAESRLQLYPVEDRAGVDARRTEVGLPPLAEYLRQFGIETGDPELDGESE